MGRGISSQAVEFAIFCGIQIFQRNFTEFCRNSEMTDDQYDRQLHKVTK